MKVAIPTSLFPLLVLPIRFLSLHLFLGQKIKPRHPKCMFLCHKRYQSLRPAPSDKSLYNLRFGALQRSTKKETRIIWQHKLKMLAFCPGAEKQSVGCDPFEGIWMGEHCDTEGGEESMVEGIENRVLGIRHE